MQNTYEGPAEDFAMVVPVPVVLGRDNVKTLPPEIFARVDRLTAPQLVEYWEQNPCPRRAPPGEVGHEMAFVGQGSVTVATDHGVKVESRFAVGEYDVAVLNASDAMGLDTWLRKERYRIPSGAEAVLRPYVQGGMKFFVARIDPRRIRFVNGRATLSPLASTTTPRPSRCRCASGC
jgi:hypothetical protein